MAHELLGNRFLERESNTPAWHGLGTIFTKTLNVTAAEAFEMAGLGFRVVKTPAGYLNESGVWVPMPDKYMLVRAAHTYQGVTDPEVVIGGPVSKDYTALDNGDIAAALEPLAAKWPIETVGAIKDGAVIFVTFDGGEFDIKGDPHRLFFLVQDGKDGVTSMQIATTPVRVVCSNTLTMGLAASNFRVKIEHTAAAYRDLDFWSTVIPQIADSSRRTKEALELLAETRATKPMVEQVINAAFKLPGMGDKARTADEQPLSIGAEHQEAIDAEIADFDYHATRMMGIRALAWERYDVFNQENPRTAKTLFAAAQAANEVAMWRNGHANSVDESSVFGPRAKESARAFRTAYQLATKGRKSTATVAKGMPGGSTLN